MKAGDIHREEGDMLIRGGDEGGGVAVTEKWR